MADGSTRIVAASQFASGAWLEVPPDASLPYARPRSGPYAIALQVHSPEKHGRFGLARHFRLLQVLQRPWLSP